MDQGRGLSAVRSLTNGPGSAASLQFLVFLLGEQRYALPLAVVKRIERVVEVTALPGAPAFVLGAVKVRGDVAPVFDLRRRFGLPLRDPELADRLIVAKTSHRLVAFLADAVQGVLKRSADQVIPAERVLPGLEYIRGVILLDDGLKIQTLFASGKQLSKLSRRTGLQLSRWNPCVSELMLFHQCGWSRGSKGLDQLQVSVQDAIPGTR